MKRISYFARNFFFILRVGQIFCHLIVILPEKMLQNLPCLYDQSFGKVFRMMKLFPVAVITEFFHAFYERFELFVDHGSTIIHLKRRMRQGR